MVSVIIFGSFLDTSKQTSRQADRQADRQTAGYHGQSSRHSTRGKRKMQYVLEVVVSNMKSGNTES